MGPTGHLVTIKRSGVDGPHFPLSLSTCLFGRGIECDIRIQLPVVSKQHCKIEVSGQEATLFNFSATNPTQVNGAAIEEPVQLRHGDVITIVDRSFRYEKESHQNGSKSPGFPGQRRKQESLRRVSRSSLSSDPDGKVQDSKARSKPSEENVSGRPLQSVQAASAVSGGSEGRVVCRTPDVVRPSEPAGGDCRHATDTPGGDLKEDASVAFVSAKGDLKSVPSTPGLENGANKESPFKKLYESLKEELDVKSEKGDVLQSGKESGSRSRRAPEQECSGGLQGGTQVPASLKSRPRSGRSTQVRADPALEEQGMSQTEDGRRGEEAVETPKETSGPIVPPEETTETRSLAPRSPQAASRKRPREDMRVASGSASVNLDQKEGFGTDNKTLTPRKSFTRNQTPAKVESADGFGGTPEKVFSRKRRSIPTSVDTLAPETETQSHAILAPLPVQVERKIPNSSVHQPEKAGATVGRAQPGLPGRSSADPSNFGDSVSKTEGTPLKRRRVSFGGRLKPELFDENLPPNTPLKRGETPRRSLVSHTPPVLKKIIKERPQPSGREDSSGLCSEATAPPQFSGSPARGPTRPPPGADDPRLASPKASSASGGRGPPQHTDVPKRGGRRSGSLLSKRTSVDRSQHEILQMIYSKRRSGASEANLIVAKSWADVVKLGAKQTQAKAVKHGPQRQLSKRPRKANTPKKTVTSVHNQFSTGHANSPCTIIIGKAHLEKVNVPARPYRTLNNFVTAKKMDFNEDLSGLAEMFQTPAAKAKPPTASPRPRAFSHSDDVRKEFQVPDSGEKPLLSTSEAFGENVFPVAQNAPQELSGKSPASPVLRRRSIRVDANIEETPGPGAEAPKAASSAHRLRRSAGLRGTWMPGVGRENEEATTDTVENASGRRLRKTPQQERKLEGAAREQEGCAEAPELDTESEETSEEVAAVRRSRRYSEQKQEPVTDLTPLKRWRDTEPKEDPGDIKGLLRTPIHAQEPKDAENKATGKRQKSSKSERVGTPARISVQLKSPPQTVDLEEEPSALRKPAQTPRGSPRSHGEPVGEDEDFRLFKETPKQKLDPAENVSGSKRRPRTPKIKVQSLEDLAGLRELFQTPNHTHKPMTGDQTTKTPCKTPLAGPVSTPTSLKRQLKTPPQKADLEEEPPALRKPTETPGGRPHSHGEPVGDDKDIKLFNKTPGQKLKPAENVTGSKRRPRTPKKNVQALQDLLGLKELFQTPEHTLDPMTDDKTTRVPCKSPLAGPGYTPASRKRQLETPPQKVDLEEEPSALRKPTQTPGGSPQSRRDPGGNDKDSKLFNKTPGQKLNPALTGSKSQTRTPKKSVQSLEDLVGLRELFQTPNHTDKPMTDDRTTKAPCKSTLTEPVTTPTSRRQLETPPQTVDLEEEPSALRKPTQTPGGSPHNHREPVGGDEDIGLFKESSEEKLDPVGNVTRSKRRPRTPKTKVQSLEDLAGLKELFRTPNYKDKPMTDDKTTVLPCKSPLEEPGNTPASRKRQLETPPQKVDLEEEPSTLRKPTRMPGGSPRSHGKPLGEDEDFRLFKETPKQKLDPAENVSGSKRRPRTPKIKVQSLEDLAGLRELFQTPNHTHKPMTDDQTTKAPCKSPLAGPVSTPTSLKRQLKTPPQKVNLEEEPPAFRMSTRTPGRSSHSHGEPVGNDKDITLFKKIPEQKLDPVRSVTASKKRLRTGKEKDHFLEDMVGFKELFQTPEQTKKTTAIVKTAILPCKSPLAETVSTPTHTKTRLKVPLGKVAIEKELSAVTKHTQRPEEATHTERERVGEAEDIKSVTDTPKQKPKPAENVTGSKRRPRTPKGKVPSLEDLIGLKELFQTPDPVTGDQTTKVSCKSPLAEQVNTPSSRKRQLKTPPQKVDLEQEPSTLRKPTQLPGGSTHSHGGPVGEDEDIRLFKETLKQKLKPAENGTGNKKQPRTPRKSVQSLEDLVGLKELFQSPNHTDNPMTGDQTIKVLCKSPLARPGNKPTNRRRRLKTPPQKVDLKEEPSALRKPTRVPGGGTHSHRDPVGGDEDIGLFKETPEEKLDPVGNVTRSKRQPRIPKEKVQSLEDPVGLKELFQSPNHTDKPMTDDTITKAPCKSPPAEPGNKPTNRRRRLKTPPQKVDLEEEPSALRKPTRVPGGGTHSHRDPVGGDEDISLFKETPEEKLDPVGNVTRSKRQPRIPKEMVQSLEDPVGLKELFQTPNDTDKPMNDDTITKAPCKSPLARPGNKPTNRRRRLKAPPQKADLKEEPSALRKPTRTPEENTHSLGESGGDDKDVRLLARTAKQKLGPAENVAGRKHRLRAPKEKAQRLEDLAGFRASLPVPDRTQELGGDAGGRKGAPRQMPDGGKPVEILPRVLRAPRGKPVEDLAGRGDPAKSRGESSVSLSPKRKRGNEGGVTGTKRLRSVTPAQAAAEEKPPQKKRRGAPGEGCDPPGPLTMKRKLRIVAERMELPEDPTRSTRETRRKGREAERTTPPQQGMSLRSRRPNKTELEEQRPEPVKAAAEKVKTKRSDEKPVKTSQEMKPRSPEGGAKNPTPGGQVRARRTCLRSARPKKTPSPDAAEEKQREKGAGVHAKNQGEEVTQRAGIMSLRSRKITIPPGGNALESESQQRVTRRAKRCAESIKKDDDNVSIKRIRTRSRRDNEDVS